MRRDVEAWLTRRGKENAPARPGRAAHFQECLEGVQANAQASHASVAEVGWESFYHILRYRRYFEESPNLRAVAPGLDSVLHRYGLPAVCKSSPPTVLLRRPRHLSASSNNRRRDIPLRMGRVPR